MGPFVSHAKFRPIDEYPSLILVQLKLLLVSVDFKQ